MIDRSASWFVFGILVVLAAITFWLDRIIQPQPSGPRDVSSLDPDYIVDGLSAVETDVDGRVNHTLRAQRMTHYPEQDLTTLVEPKFTAYTEGQGPLTVTSREGRMLGNGENVYFERDVRVVRVPPPGSSDLVLETSFLHVIPDAKIATTDRPVTIHDATGVVKANGLELNSDTRVLHLQGRVRGTFSSQAARGGSDAR